MRQFDEIWRITKQAYILVQNMNCDNRAVLTVVINFHIKLVKFKLMIFPRISFENGSSQLPVTDFKFVF